MITKAKETSLNYKMFDTGDTVVACVSGGADSMALLHFLSNYAKEIGLDGKESVICCHFHHGLRGAEADRDAKYVETYCRNNNIVFHLGKADVRSEAVKRGIGTEECGRLLRYEFARNLGEKYGKYKIATAHTLSDSVETAVFHFARGTGLAGLRGIPAIRGDIVRPLINCTREDTEKYCNENGIDFVIDSTNLTDEYTRNFIRHNIVPALKRINPSVENTFRKMFIRNFAEDEYLDIQANELLKKAENDNGYDIEILNSAHKALKSRAIMLILKKYDVLNEQSVEYINNLLNCKGTVQIKRNIFFHNNGNVLSVEIKNESKSIIEKNLEIGENDLGNGKKIFCSLINNEKFNKSSDNILKNCLDCGKINGKLVFTSRRDGDSIRIINRGCSKSLKKLFNENSIPVEDRKMVACLRDDTGLVWLEGFGVDERVSVTESTENIITINNI